MSLCVIVTHATGAFEFNARSNRSARRHHRALERAHAYQAWKPVARAMQAPPGTGNYNSDPAIETPDPIRNELALTANAACGANHSYAPSQLARAAALVSMLNG